MKITTLARDLIPAVERRIAKVTMDINDAEARIKQLTPEAEISESAKKAMQQIRLGVDRAKKIRDSLTQMFRALAGMDPGASVELNDNEAALMSYVDVS